MKGCVVAVDTLPDGRGIAALVVDGKLDDLLVDPPSALGPVQPGAIFRGVVGRPLKGQGGMMVRLDREHSGFLRETKGLAPGNSILVQVNTAAEAGKAAPVTTRLLFKSRYAIITPGRPGLNISRQIRDEEERDRLAGIACDVMSDCDHGLILRTAADGVDADVIAEDIESMRELADRVLSEGNEPGLMLEAPDARTLAWRDWTDVELDEVRDVNGSFEDLGLWDAVEALAQPRVDLGQGAFMTIEPTRALVAIDVNTGSDTSVSAGLKADIAALRALPRALRLRGLGGQIVIDPAPYPKKERKVLEQVLRAALRADRVETSIAGWTPLGHIELQRKRERRPLKEVLKL